MQHKDNQGLAPPKEPDPGWAHGIKVDGNRQKIKCNYCGQIKHGGITRLKQHLAGHVGNVTSCENVSPEVRSEMERHLRLKPLERSKMQKGMKSGKDSPSYIQGREEGDDGDVVQNKNMVSARGTSKRRGKEVVERISNRSERQNKQYFSSVVPIVAEPIQQSFASQESIDQADTAVERFFCEAGIPFTAAKSQYFQEMADAIAAVGPGNKMASYHSLWGKFLNRCVEVLSKYVEELRKSWEVTGCSVMVDRWMDSSRTVINFLVYCPKGTMFLKSVDASEITSPEALLNLFDDVVQEVGQNNIVNFLTDTSPTYKAAGKLLMEKYKTFCCTTCGVHCIDLMLEGIGKIDVIREVLAKAKQVTQFIYNNAWVLILMRKKTSGRDIIQLATTRFASIFLTLQNMLSLKSHLHRMFTGSAWMHSTFSKERAGLEVAEVIVDPHFWSRCDQTLKVTEPLLSVLQLMDCGEEPSVGYIYDAMEKAKKSIIDALNNEESAYLPYLEVIDHIWQEEFHSSLHAAAYYLNPSIFYNPSFSSNEVIQKGLIDCIETLEPDSTAQVMIKSPLVFYEEALGGFGKHTVVQERDSLAPATWWSLYAADYPDLQRLAVRILSQTCSIDRCDRSWIIFERVHLKKTDLLEDERLNDLIFGYYNWCFQERRPEASKATSRRGTLDPLCLEAIDANMGDWVDPVTDQKNRECAFIDRILSF